jgi:hypothetical protein
MAKISKERLQELPVDERALFLSLAHLSNEIIALQKLILWSYDVSSENESINNGHVAMSLMLIKLLSGKLKEGHNLLKKKFFGTKISRSYAQSLSDKCKETLVQLKRYFGNRNVIDVVRNNYAFHYTPEELNAALPKIPEDLILYIEKEGKGNNLHYFAEVIANRALLQSLGKQDEFEAFMHLIGESTRIADWLLTISDAIMNEFLQRHISDIWESNAIEVYFDKLPSFNDISIPWFTDNSVLYEKDA